MSLQNTEPALWDFARFAEGQSLGVFPVTMDRNRLHLWTEVFEQPVAGDQLSRSLFVSAMMEAYLAAAQPRPPGNIHAGQTITCLGRPPRVGETLAIAISVAGKAERRGRKWLRFACAIRAEEELLLEGEILTIWAK